MLTWASQHQSAALLLNQGESASLLNAALAKFARAVTPAKLAHFDGLPGLLRYLKMCVHSVIADELRSRRSRQNEEPLELCDTEPVIIDPAGDVVSNAAALGLWQAILQELKRENEQVLIYLSFMQEMEPMEICQKYRKLFPTVDDVYRIKRNVVERLRRGRCSRKLREYV
jgi:hypothetical protein